MLFPNMSSLLRTKERLSYSVFSTLIRAFGLSSHGTNFEKFENKSENHFMSTGSEVKSVIWPERLGKWASHDEINERFKKQNVGLQAANLGASMEMETAEVKKYRLINLTDTEVHELSTKFYLGMSKVGKHMLRDSGQIEEELEKIDAMILSKRQGKQIETKVSMPEIHLCNRVLFIVGRIGYIGSLDKAFDIYELMSQHGPEPNEVTYNAIFEACIKSRFARKEEILKIAKKLLRDIQDRGIQIHDETHKALMNLFATVIDSKLFIDLIPFLLDEVGKEHSGRILSIVLNSSLYDRQRGFHDAICAWRLITCICRMPSIEPTLEDFRTLLLITYHCEIANEDEFQRMLQKTAYPYSNEEFWNDSKRHEVKNNSPFAFRNEKDEMDFSKDEPTRCTLGIENKSNAESQLKKSTQIELTEMVELLKMNTRRSTRRKNSMRTLSMNTRRKNSMRTLSNHLSFPLNVKWEHKISNILNPFETLPSVISLPGRVTSEDRKSLLDGIKEFRIRVHEAGEITRYWVMNIGEKTPMTIAIEPSLLRLVLEMSDNSLSPHRDPITRRMFRKRDHAAAKEMWRILEQPLKEKPTRYMYESVCNSLDNEKDVFQFLRFMQMEGIHPDILTFSSLLKSRWGYHDLSYQKMLLKEMSWLNICPNEYFLQLMNEVLLEINSEILKQENSSRDVENTDESYISREEFENFVTFYHEWLTMQNL